MIDRKKVIKGLDYCIMQAGDDDFDCRVCPYFTTSARLACWIDLLIDALELLKAKEARVMTEQEMRDAEPGAVIYCEQRDEVRTYLTPMIKNDDGVFENRFLGAVPEATQLPNIRFWTSRPTDEQRKAAAWE